MTRLACVALGVLALAWGRDARFLAAASLTLADVPKQLSDREFLKLSNDLSEPDGFFASDNLVSDERIFARVVPELTRTARLDGVYMGVGPDQNFTYIAAIQPRMAFIVDVRRGNLLLHLMYKALFELSADRAEFISRLFTKPRPAGLGPKSTANDILRAFWNLASSDRATYQRNLQAIDDVLVKKHGFALSADDLQGIANVYYKFYWYGPSITWSSSSGSGRRSGEPTFMDLIVQTDASGEGLSYLASEARFVFVKALQARNAIVPVIGNFAGPKALRAVGDFIRAGHATVTAFYVDEVEPYLRQDGMWSAFCGNAATLPLDDASVFIRSPLAIPGSGPPFAARTPGQTALEPKSLLFPIASEVTACRGGGQPVR